MTTANIIYFALGELVGMAVAILVMLPEYRRHDEGDYRKGWSMQELTKEQIQAANKAWNAALQAGFDLSLSDKWEYIIRSIAPHVQFESQVNGDVVDTMIDAYHGGRLPINEERKICMTFALRLANAARDKQHAEAVDRAVRSLSFLTSHGIVDVLEAIQKEVERIDKPKTPEERVTIFSGMASFSVLLDGVVKHDFDDRENAEIYRLGLIAKLKDNK